MLSQMCHLSFKCFCVLSQGRLIGGILFLMLDYTKCVRMPKDRNYSEGGLHLFFYSLLNAVLTLLLGVAYIAFSSLHGGDHFKGLCGPMLQCGAAFSGEDLHLQLDLCRGFLGHLLSNLSL